jgi:hypothetical protein
MTLFKVETAPDGLSQVTVNGDSDLVASNIKKDVEIFGVTGTYEGSGGSDELGIALLTGNLSSEFIIPSTVSMLGSYALYGRANITSLYGPCVTAIRSSACQYMRSLIYASFPELSDVVGLINAFAYCSNLQEFHANKLTNIASQMFYSCSKLSIVDAPSTMQVLDMAFYNCKSLSTVSFPNLTYINSSAFVQCGLVSANFPKLKSMSSTAFFDCVSLQYFSAPLLTYVSNSVFKGAIGLESVYLPNVVSVGSYAFSNCSRLSSVVFPSDGLRMVSTGAFWNCQRLPSINLQSVAFAQWSAFQSCWSLSEVQTGSRLSSIGSSCFAYCSRLKSFTLQYSGSGYIYTYAFAYCSSLVSVYIVGSGFFNLSNSNAFIGTPLSNSALNNNVYGSIYVAESLYNSYITATNWSLYSSRFVSLTDAQISAILNS